MKAWFKTFILLCGVVQAHAQAEFSTVDALARSVRKNERSSPESIAQMLCKDLKSDRDKARAIFTWITQNLRYDVQGPNKEGPDAKSQAEYNAKRVKQAFRKGQGICMDFALLYQTMAQTVGLECAFIPGISRGSLRGGLGVHAWNAVKIQGKWELLDVTWGAGSVKQDHKFHTIFKPGYCFTLPRIFALDHFPDEEKWQLLEHPISKETFKKQANFDYGNPEKEIQDSEPFGIPIRKGADGKMELRLKFNQAPTIFELKSGGRELKFERSERDGWVILRFAPTNGRELQVWGGEKNNREILVKLLGVFPTN